MIAAVLDLDEGPRAALEAVDQVARGLAQRHDVVDQDARGLAPASACQSSGRSFSALPTTRSTSAIAA